MIKAKFGQRLRSKSLTTQINEALCKVLCHNLCVVIQSVHELGIEPTFLAEAVAASKTDEIVKAAEAHRNILAAVNEANIKAQACKKHKLEVWPMPQY